MAEFEHRDNSGSLFVNKRKTTDNHPDRTGDAKIICPACEAAFMLRMSGWVKPGKNGNPNWMSLALTPGDIVGNVRPKANLEKNEDRGDEPVAISEPKKPPRQPYDSDDSFDDDIPF